MGQTIDNAVDQSVEVTAVKSQAEEARIRAEESDTRAMIADSSARAADLQAQNSEKVAQVEATKASELEAELSSNPPTMQVPKGGKKGGTKTVIDENAVRQMKKEIAEHRSNSQSKMQLAKTYALDATSHQEESHNYSGEARSSNSEANLYDKALSKLESSAQKVSAATEDTKEVLAERKVSGTVDTKASDGSEQKTT